MADDVQADLVHEAERAEGQAERHHGVVDLLDGAALHGQLARLVHVDAQQAVDDEPGAVLAQHGHLADVQHELICRGRHGRVGALVADDLHQRHAHDGLEEVNADDALGPRGSRGQLGDGQRGGVGGKDGGRLHGLLALLQDGLLQVHTLHGGLDDEVAVGQRREVGAAGDQRAKGGGLRVLQLALGHARSEGIVDVLEGAVDDGLLDVAEVHGDASTGQREGDLRTHHAGADHSDAADLRDGAALSFPFFLASSMR